MHLDGACQGGEAARRRSSGVCGNQPMEAPDPLVKERSDHDPPGDGTGKARRRSEPQQRSLIGQSNENGLGPPRIECDDGQAAGAVMVLDRRCRTHSHYHHPGSQGDDSSPPRPWPDQQARQQGVVGDEGGPRWSPDHQACVRNAGYGPQHSQEQRSPPARGGQEELGGGWKHQRTQCGHQPQRDGERRQRDYEGVCQGADQGNPVEGLGDQGPRGERSHERDENTHPDAPRETLKYRPFSCREGVGIGSLRRPQRQQDGCNGCEGELEANLAHRMGVPSKDQDGRQGEGVKAVSGLPADACGEIDENHD